MSLKRNTYMPLNARTVKKTSAAALAGLALCLSTLAPNAIANGSPMVEKAVTVTFTMTDIRAPQGVKTVYSKLEKRAETFCKGDKASLKFLGQTIEQCADDLVSQFINSADIDALTALHTAKTRGETAKLAFNQVTHTR